MNYINDEHSDADDAKALMWGSIANQINKIGDELDKKDHSFDKFSNVIEDAYTIGEKETDAFRLFFDLHQFLFRLTQRIRKMESMIPINSIDYYEREDAYVVKNYDYKMFLWARSRQSDKIDNFTIIFPRDELTAAEARSFEKKLNK